MSTSYVIRGDEQGTSRMRVVARAMWPTTERLLFAAGLTSGRRCLDVGCGAGDVSLPLARVVGASGCVTGVEQDEIRVQFAREDASRDGLSNLQFRASNAEQLENDAEYDLVYARFLLTHLRDPAAVLRRMVRAGLFREAGVSELHVSHVQPVYIDGEAKHIHRITLDNIAPALIAAGFATDTEIEALRRALDAFLTGPDTLVSTPRIFQVWAQRPLA